MEVTESSVLMLPFAASSVGVARRRLVSDLIAADICDSAVCDVALVISELQYSYPSLGGMVYSDKQPLAGTYRLGFWYDTEDFADQEYDVNGLSLANPASNGVPRNHHGDYAFYAVADQMIWSDPKDEDADRTVNVFARAM